VLGSLVIIGLAALSPREAGAGRLVGIFSDSPNRLGYPTAYLLPFVMVFVRAWWNRGLRLLATVTAAGVTYLFVWALAASASRGAAAAAVVALLLALGLPRGPERRGRVVLRFVVVGAIIVVGLLAAYRSPIFPPTLKDRIERTLADEESLVGDREQLALAGLRAFRESPLVGTGLDNFRYVSTLYGDGVGEQAPHNMWIQFAAQVGIIGTIAFFIIILQWFRTVLRARSATTEQAGRELLWAFVVSMLALMIIFMTIPVMVERHYWLIFGLGLALASGSAPQRARPPVGAQARGPRDTR
jgi:O-antigen ligase